MNFQKFVFRAFAGRKVYYIHFFKRLIEFIYHVGLTVTPKPIKANTNMPKYNFNIQLKMS